MYRFLTKNGTSIAFGLGLLAILAFLIPVISNMGVIGDSTKEQLYGTSYFNLGLMVTRFMVYACLALAVLFGIWQLIANPKGAIKGIVGVVALVAIFFIFYSMAKPETSTVMTETMTKFDITEGVSKYISGALNTVLILLGIAGLAFVISEIRNVFK